MKKLTLRIRKNETGEVREYTRNDYPIDFPIDWFFGDGNGGCDCNRAAWFEHANGGPDPGVTCSEDKFAIDVISETGETLYSELSHES